MSRLPFYFPFLGGTGLPPPTLRCEAEGETYRLTLTPAGIRRGFGTFAKRAKTQNKPFELQTGILLPAEFHCVQKLFSFASPQDLSHLTISPVSRNSFRAMIPKEPSNTGSQPQVSPLRTDDCRLASQKKLSRNKNSSLGKSW